MTDALELMAAAIAKADAADFNHACTADADDDSAACGNPSCVAHNWEAHDPEWARTVYRRYAEAAIAAYPTIFAPASSPE